jgi:hypothetical protein
MWQALRRLIAANPMGIFLWGIITKWYLMIAVASLIVLFYVAKGLEQIGFIDYFTKSTIEVLDTTKAVAQNCTTKLGTRDGFVSFWNCLGNPGKYEIKEGTGEQQLQESVNKLIKSQPDNTIPEPVTPVNPYDTDDNNKN